MIDELRVANALRLLEEAAALICKEPDKCTLVWKPGATKGRIDFEVGNADDAIRLTGAKGKGLESIAKAATMLFRDTGIDPFVGVVINLDKTNKLVFKKYAPNPNWPKDKVIKLLKELAGAVFIETDIKIYAENRGDSTELSVAFPRVTDEELQFVRVMDKVFAAIGVQQGRRIVVDAEEHAMA